MICAYRPATGSRRCQRIVAVSTAFGSTSSGGSALPGLPEGLRTSRSWIITRRCHMAAIAPVHPGEVLLEEFLEPFGVTQHRLAVDIGVPPRRINEIVHGKRRITADTALRLARDFGTSDQFWLNLQTRYDLETSRDNLGPQLRAIRPLKIA